MTDVRLDSGSDAERAIRDMNPSDANDGAVLRAVDLAKAFGVTRALESASLTLEAGQVHAVIGENGSGKSTMVKLLTGVTRPDHGTIEIGGKVMAGLRSPREALDAGIVGVFQNIMVVGPQSVLDNLWLGFDGTFRRRVGDEERRTRGAEVLDELLGGSLRLDGEAGLLSLSDRQALGIARALLQRPKVLLLDEATSALDIATRDRLFAILRRLASQGASVVFISHRMDEIEEIGDRITVMRAARTVATVQRGEATTSELVRLMVGSARIREEKRLAARREKPDEVTLVEARNLVLVQSGQPINQTFRVGELVGIAGLEGQGQERFLKVLAGVRPLAGEVLVAQDSTAVRVSSRRRAESLGVAYVPRDRQNAGIFNTQSIRDNFGLPTVGRDRRFGLVSSARTSNRFAEYVASLRIMLGRDRDPISTLSGGNQQKVVVARWLAHHPKVLLLDDPTRGVDPGAKVDLYELLVDLANGGVLVIMISTDIDELIELMDRVLVFREGAVFSELSGSELDRHNLVANFFGRWGGHDKAE